jgi:hypothetical protein
MGLFFTQSAPNPELTDVIRRALTSPPSEDVTENAKLAAAQIQPITSALMTAMEAPVPADPQSEATKQAVALANTLLGGAKFNTGRFLVALAIFVALVGTAIGTEAVGLTTATGTLFGFAGATFGIVTAFLGSEKS